MSSMASDLRRALCYLHFLLCQLLWNRNLKKLDESGEVDKLADKYELDKSMLCISEDKEDSDSDSTEADTEESADSTEKEADSESK